MRVAYPWEEGELREWSIVGMNHYHVNGSRHLFVAMVKDKKCIKAEGENEGEVFAELRRLAAGGGVKKKKEEMLAPVGDIRLGVECLVRRCYKASCDVGWWNDLQTGRLLQLTQERVGDRLMLAVTELAEAKEGFRSDLMDKHLPHRKGIEVELADAMIRIADLAGALRLDLGGAIIEKLEYNAHRADHKLENRRKAGGKKT